jgi:hypothetical protein
VRFDGTSGALVQNSAATLDDTGILTASIIASAANNDYKLKVYNTSSSTFASLDFASGTLYLHGHNTAASSCLLALSESTDNAIFTTSITSPSPTFANSYVGVFSKTGGRFLHDFNYGNNGTITTDGFNCFLGLEAGNLTMGSTATSIGQSSYNTGVGYRAIYATTTGYGNSALGNQALADLTSGYLNTAMGNGALANITSGTHNVALGNLAGESNNAGSGSLITNANSVFIGSLTTASAEGDTNEIVIGYDAEGLGSDTTVLGNTSTTLTRIYGDLTPKASSGTTMTNGFTWIPSAAGAPSGTPTSRTGLVPMYYDSTNNHFYIYNGAWKKVALA